VVSAACWHVVKTTCEAEQPPDDVLAAQTSCRAYMKLGPVSDDVVTWKLRCYCCIREQQQYFSVVLIMLMILTVSSGVSSSSLNYCVCSTRPKFMDVGRVDLWIRSDQVQLEIHVIFR
jgi:hypothetical protein